MNVMDGGWSDSFGFRMAPGAHLVGRQGESYELSVSMPTDDHGFFGRQCPDCRQMFRVDADDYEALPDELRLWCVYCGHQDEHSEFVTEQQLDRAMQAVGDLGQQIVGQALDSAFGSLARSSRRGSRSGFRIEVRYRSAPFYPEPLPGIDEEALIRIRNCPQCSLRYAVFGEHRFCPSCGKLPADLVALDALSAERARLDGLQHLPADVAAGLREQGVFTRLWIDTLENLVGLVEALASATFRDALPDADDRLRGKGNIFQRLDDTASIFATAGFSDLRAKVDPTIWSRLLQTWAARHVFTHNDGVVDARYLAKVPQSTAVLGQRLTTTESACRQAIDDTEVLCRAVASLTADRP